MVDPSDLAPFTSEPDELALLLDLDGTLAPIVPDPDAVAIPGTIRRSLERLTSRIGLVAFISGRSLADLRRIVAMDGVLYSGNHGTEIVGIDGRPIDAGVGDPAPLREFADGWRPDELERHGLWLEDKGATLTFHYRNAPDVDMARAFLDAHVAPRGRDTGLRVEPGRMSLEVHPAGDSSKGTATRIILADAPAIRSVISIGDDRTDVTVWTMLASLRDERRLERTLCVGVRSSETPPIVTDSADRLVDGVVPGTDTFLHVLADSLPS